MPIASMPVVVMLPVERIVIAPVVGAELADRADVDAGGEGA